MKIPLLSILLVTSVAGYAQEASGTSWTPSNQVNSITYGDNKVFIAGDFDWFGERIESQAFVFTPALGEVSGYPVIQGPIQHSIPDGAGGWYTAAYGIITHIKSDKTAEELPFLFEGGGYPIRAMEKTGNTLYVIGQFTTVNSIARGYGAAIDLTNNTLLSWNPASGGYIYCIKASAGVIYVGGSFTSIGGQTRSRVAALDAATALATSWNPNVAAGGYVFTIEADASAVYFGGSFTNAGGGSPTRTNFAAVNKTTGALTSFNPRPDDDVVALALDGNTLYLAGDFTHVAGVTKHNIAAVDITTGTATSFAVTLPTYYSKNIYALAIDGSKLFIGGNFNNLNKAQIGNLAVVNKITGANEPTEDRAIGGSVLTITPSGGNILVGGNLLGITGVSNSYGCVALDGVTGTGTSWRPELPDLGTDTFLSSLKLHYQNNTVYYISEVYLISDGPSGVIVGALNSSDGSALPGWPIALDGNIADWAFSDDALYLAGDFSNVNGVAREGFAALDLTTGEVLPWTLGVPLFFGDGDDLYSIVVENNVFYLAGQYSFNFNGEDRTNFSAWDATTGDLLAWNPTVEAAPIGAIADGKVYMIGPEVVRVDATTGDTDSWTPDFDPQGGMVSMVVKGNDVYYAGYFSPGIVRVDINTGELAAVQPQLEDPFFSEGSVRALAVSSNKLYAGGSFGYQVSTQYRFNYAEYPLLTTNSAPEITSVFRSIPVQSIVSVFLPDIVTDIDDNADLTTAEIISQPQSGASAYIDGDYLIVDYTGLAFAGSDILTLRVCDTEAACAEQQITIELDGSVRVYNAISPNGDGKNEIMRIANIELFTKNHVSVFNRWGDLVFETDNYNNDDRVFKGVSNGGKDLPSGIYYYKIEFPGGQKTRTGYLSLRR